MKRCDAQIQHLVLPEGHELRKLMQLRSEAGERSI